MAALKASIKKWDNLANAKSLPDHPNGDNCPLCKLFSARCDGCPVMERTGFDGCAETPYWEASKAWGLWYADADDAATTFRNAARTEADFLRTLLPEDDE
jgi:hypothetical protein